METIKYDRTTINRKNVPKEITSVFYDENDNVLFGNTMIKGLVSYYYLDSKYSTDDKPIYLYCSIEYNGEGNSTCPNPELIKPFNYIKRYLE